ncbi:MAG: PilT/PilU family type 4a pilus ATPase [Candidatus Hydrogenedentes bacterium]|nr:PilT/PilU family type 4a pilus ATPase [Candidatus Hydrogenedentota bacterium]
MPVDIAELVRVAKDMNASDIHLKSGTPPTVRVDGLLRPMHDMAPLTESDLDYYLVSICGDEGAKQFRVRLDSDMNYSIPDVSHLRVNVCLDRGIPRIVLRLIPIDIMSLEQLELPPIIKTITENKNGLAIVTGPTGSGKSTTLAAMIDEINWTRAVHVVTIEDPIEYVHSDKKAIITQRQVGLDTRSFENALRGVLRQDPDVILIGELRDAETMATALSAAETGHLVLSTLHTVDAVETLYRIMDFFPATHQEQIRKQFGSVLRGIISQRLVPRACGEGRIAAVEILVGNSTVRDFILKGSSFSDIVRLMEEGYDRHGMQTFDQALYDLWKEEKITKEVALENSSTARDLQLRMEGMR